MANKALVYTIYPNEKQNIQCQKTFGCCRFVYNQMLDVQKERHENGENLKQRQIHTVTSILKRSILS